MKKQLHIDYAALELRGVSKGAKAFLWREVKEHLALYENYPLHERINMKANSLSPRCILGGHNRFYVNCYDMRQRQTLNHFYEQMRLNRFNAYDYITENEKQSIIHREGHYDKIYSIILRTLNDEKMQSHLLKQYIETGVYETQKKLFT